MIVEIDPIGKPRMTQRDRWKQRPCVIRYFHFCDALRAQVKFLPVPLRIEFRIAMPSSWSKPKKIAFEGTPHRQKPDLDNCIKSVGDALLDDDSVLHDIRARKIWARTGSIEIEEAEEWK